MTDGGGGLMFALTLASDKQAMGRYDDAIVDCKTAIVNDPEVCKANHLLQNGIQILIHPIY